jgi:ribosomal-protein-alanine N-acetyltransferase
MKTFDTPRLTLRAWTADDLDDAYRVLVVEQDDEHLSVEAVIEELQFDATLAQQQIGERFSRLAMVLKAENKIIGTVVLMPVFCSRDDLSLLYPDVAHSSIEAEIGYALSKNYRKQGYTTEAARALVDYGFNVLHLSRIIAYTTKTNTASIAVLHRLGMRLAYHPDNDTVIGVTEK